MGERLLARWLRQPLLDQMKIEARLNIVEMLKDDSATRSTLQDSALRGTPDLETLSVRLQRKRAGAVRILKFESGSATCSCRVAVHVVVMLTAVRVPISHAA
jgi:DNA mismatch repair protein MSH2